jgi:hypothetical protein
MHKLDETKPLKIGFFFKPFDVPSHGHPLAQAKLNPNDELIILERKGKYHALLAREMAYHHVAQGELAGEPYLVTF